MKRMIKNIIRRLCILSGELATQIGRELVFSADLCYNWVAS